MRWDLNKYLGEENVHWISILNSIMIALFLSGIIAHILRRTLKRDLKTYNEVKKKKKKLKIFLYFIINLYSFIKLIIFFQKNNYICCK